MVHEGRPVAERWTFYIGKDGKILYVDRQVKAAMRLALGREPKEGELAVLTEYAKKHGLANACRVILNLNEFVFVD